MRLRFACSLCTALFFAAVGSSAALSGCSGGHASTIPPDVVFSDAGVNVNGQPIPVPATQQQLIAVVGDPSRRIEVPKTYTALVWDDRGMVAFFKPASDDGYTITTNFRNGDHEYSPKGIFRHAISIDGKNLTSSSTDADLKAAGFKEVPGSAVPTFQRSIGKLECTAEIDPSSKQIATISLTDPAAK